MNDIVREFEMTPWERAAAQAKRTEEADLWKDFSKTLTRNSAGEIHISGRPARAGRGGPAHHRGDRDRAKSERPGLLTGA